jgi:hypothetical protein
MPDIPADNETPLNGWKSNNNSNKKRQHFTQEHTNRKYDGAQVKKVVQTKANLIGMN